MSDSVVSTEVARQAIQAMQRVVSGPLLEQIRILKTEGQKLSQPDVWNGRKAREFRAVWPEQHNRLVRIQQDMEDLRARIQRVHDDIWTAGGG